jgi:hypothetical protein
MPRTLVLATEASTRTYFEWGRIQSNADWILPGLAFAVVVFLARYWYRRDAAELRRVTRLTLTALRVSAFAGLLWIYLQPQWRIERDLTSNSQALLLVDTSLSMGLPDESFPSSASAPSRVDRVIQAFKGQKLLGQLRQTHDVSVLRFDQQIDPIAMLPRLPKDGQPPAGAAASEESGNGRPTVGRSEHDWSQALAARGLETRLGQALQDCLSDQHGPIAGVVLFTDGGQNSGPSPRQALALARQAGIRVHTVGLGSNRQPTNVRIADLVAPVRAFPGDTYTITGYLQAQGMAGRSVRLELLSSPAEDNAKSKPASPQLEAASELRLGADGEITPVTFDLTPAETGRRTLTLRIDAPADDSNPNDNQQEADIEIVAQKTRVLLYASGPTREYRFLHTLLFRDNNVEVDIFLGTAQEGISQEARQILNSFPRTREEFDQYDLIVAFDPDWQSLTPESIANLEHWVANQAGGLVVIPGTVYSDGWAEKPELSKIRDLYPVEFRRRFSLTSVSPAASRDPWPLEFTREGLEADFLWLADSAAGSQQAWTAFSGVYDCLPVRGPKPGATVYARFSDPQAATGSQPMVYFCGQFYGSGRVFYMGSGEMWRLRGLDTDYFDQFYTKLIRHVSQGRWLRGSSRGVLLTERDRYFLGQTVGIRAQLSDARLEPLAAPSVSLTAILPDNTPQTVRLEPDGGRAGNFSGQFVVRQEGTYRLELVLPDAAQVRLEKRIQVRVPDLERENPRRNDALLAEISATTGGHYYVGLEDALGQKQAPPVWQLLPDRSRVHPQSEKPRLLWDNWIVLCVVAGCLSLEWLLRRLMKLA